MSRPTTPLPTSAPQSTSYPLPNGPYLSSLPKSTTGPDATLSSPPRSTTFHQKPSRPHIPHHPHRTHHHHHHDKSVPQSAITAPSHNSLGDFLTKTTGRLADRDTYPALPGAGGTKTPPRLDPATGVEGIKEEAQLLRDEQERRRKAAEVAKWKEVSKLKTSRQEADEDLRSTLAQLSTLSTTTTRRLDYTYYSLLSSLSALRSGVASLHNLSTSTHHLSEKFTTQTEEITAENKATITNADENFARQAQRIEGLESRLQAGREKAGKLGQRLDVVRARVEHCAERDGEGRRRVRGFWRMGWVGLVGCSLAVLVVVLVGTPPGGDLKKPVFWEMEKGEGTLGREDIKRGLEGPREPNRSRESHPPRDRPTQGEETRRTGMIAEKTLRMFDEL